MSEKAFVAAEAMSKKGMPAEQFIAKVPRGDWLIWFLWEAGLTTIEQVIMAGCAAGRLSLKYAKKQDLEVLTAAFDAANAVAVDNTQENRDVARAASWDVVDSSSYSPVHTAASASAAASARAATAAVAASAAYHVAATATAAASAAYYAASIVGHPTCADAVRELMKTERWEKAEKFLEYSKEKGTLAETPEAKG